MGSHAFTDDLVAFVRRISTEVLMTMRTPEQLLRSGM